MKNEKNMWYTIVKRKIKLMKLIPSYNDLRFIKYILILIFYKRNIFQLSSNIV